MEIRDALSDDPEYLDLFAAVKGLKVALIRHLQTDIGAAGANVPFRKKAHSGVSSVGAAGMGHESYR